MEPSSPTFANDKEAIQYWRNLALEYKERLIFNLQLYRYLFLPKKPDDITIIKSYIIILIKNN